jgi:NADH-quinone oxidoreductase subunit H
MVRWTFPRFRYDQIMTLGWKVLLPLGLFNVFLSGALVLVDPSLHALAIVGLLEIALLVGLTLTQAAKKPSAGHGGSHSGSGAHAHPAAAASAHS